MDIRHARIDDAAAVASIYNHAVTTSTDVFELVPRTVAEQEEWLGARSGAHAVLVADDAGAVVGFASLSPYNTRPAYRTTVESSVFVREDRHRQGIGRALLDHLVAIAKDHGFHAVIARVGGENEASVRLHEGAGFEQIGREREVGRKFNRWLDVVVLERLLS